MKKYTYQYNDDIFNLKVQNNIFLNGDYEVTTLYINNLALFENQENKADFYFELIKCMSEYDSDTIEERLTLKSEFDKYSLFTPDNFYYKTHINSQWNVMSGKDYENFYDWLVVILIPHENTKKERKVKLNNIMRNGKI